MIFSFRCVHHLRAHISRRLIEAMMDNEPISKAIFNLMKFSLTMLKFVVILKNFSVKFFFVRTKN